MNRQLNGLIIAKYAKQARKREERRGKEKGEREKSYTAVVIVLQLLSPQLAGRFWRFGGFIHGRHG